MSAHPRFRRQGLAVAFAGLFALAACDPTGSLSSLPGRQDEDRALQRAAPAARAPVERVEIEGRHWHINGQITYPDTAAEGLLMNVRMVNAVFEDRRRPQFDPEANLDRFLRALPGYADSGIRAITLSLQGGFPGYEGALNSAFEPDGTLRRSYLDRVQRAITAAGNEGVVVILGLFYQRQSAVLADESAIRRGVVDAVRWVRAMNFRNVVVEIANEYGHRGFVHDILRTAQGQVALIELARREAPGLLISTSGGGHGRLDPEVADASDFLLIHFNLTPIEQIPARVAALARYGKPIVCNEDDKVGPVGSRAARISVQNGASWGFMDNEKNQYWPFEFEGSADDRVVYRTILQLTTPR